jgi:hypothetical protein
MDDDVPIGLENASFLGSMVADQPEPMPAPLPVPVPAATPAPANAAPSPAPPVGPVVSAADDCLRVSYHCKATKCFRLQWEAESELAARQRAACPGPLVVINLLPLFVAATGQ